MTDGFVSHINRSVEKRLAIYHTGFFTGFFFSPSSLDIPGVGMVFLRHDAWNKSFTPITSTCIQYS